MPEKQLSRRVAGGGYRYQAAPDATPKVPGKLFGYIAKFGVESAQLWDEGVTDDEGTPIPFVEVIDPHAFDRTLRENKDIRALYNHKTSDVLGRTTSGTLKLTVDAVGLAFENSLPDTQAGRDVEALVKRGDLSGASFGFFVEKDRVEQRDGKPAIRTLLDIDLFEVSVAVAFPAYEDSEVSVRARREWERRKAKPGPSARARYEYERRRLDLMRHEF